MTKVAPKRVLLTGITSFTGCHIARAFKDAGHDVVATLTRSLDQYSGRHLVERLKYAHVPNFSQSSPLGSEAMQKLVKEYQPEVFVNHGAAIQGYRNADFNVAQCVADSTQGLAELFKQFASYGTHVVHSGSVFERDDQRQMKSYSPYGEAKTLIWERLQELATKCKVTLSKVVVADPVGPFENRDRLAPVLFGKWARSEKVEVRNPDFVWDRVPAEWLAQKYVEAALAGVAKIYRPSAFVATNLDWVKILQKIYQSKTNEETPELLEQGQETGSRVNTETCAELADINQVTAFFDRYGDWLLS